ncbi:MAG TPA: hypothetical protein ENL11_06340 [Candidatus Acetothermia bacterium]|nr:hypothetical protein [Candidatus Acetothermia bacterium]
MAEIRFDPKAPSILVPTALFGPKGALTVNMVFDTGASFVTIPRAVAKALGYSLRRPVSRVKMITASRVERAPLIVLDRVAVAGEAIQNVEALVHDLPPQGMAEGLLGLSFLRHFKLGLDFERGLVELSRPS